MIKNKSLRALIIAVLIAGLSVLLLIVGLLVGDRQRRQREVQHQLNEQWSQAQQINGPYLRVEGQTTTGKKQLTVPLNFAASDLLIDGVINPRTRKRGIYEVVLYDSKLKFSGSFKDFNIDGENISDIDWAGAEIYFGISDMRGLNKNIVIKAGDETLELTNTNTRDFLKAKLLKLTTKPDELNFSFIVDFRGSEYLQFSPSSVNTKVRLTSTWPNPSFYGSFLPIKHSIHDRGFSAHWNVLEMNRNLPRVDQNININNARRYGFGVKLIQPNDNYQKNERAVKYGILIISLTFLGFFFTEILLKSKVSIIQYGLVGLALIVFYLLLLSFSEIITFNPAYVLSSVMTIGLIYLFCRGIFTSFKPPLIIAAITTVAYAFIFIIIQLEDTALMVGSIGLFVILAITMWASRKINWESSKNEA